MFIVLQTTRHNLHSGQCLRNVFLNTVIIHLEKNKVLSMKINIELQVTAVCFY